MPQCKANHYCRILVTSDRPFLLLRVSYQLVSFSISFTVVAHSPKATLEFLALPEDVQ